MGRKIDLSKKVIKEEKITKKIKSTYTHSFYYANNHQNSQPNFSRQNGLYNDENDYDNLDNQDNDFQDENNQDEAYEDNMPEEQEEYNDQDDNNDDSADEEEENEDDNSSEEDSQPNENSKKDKEKQQEKRKQKQKERQQQRIEKRKEKKLKVEDAKKTKKILTNPLTIKIILIVLAVALIVLGIALLIALIIGIEEMSGVYYSYKCNEITVINVDEEGNPTDSKTYNYEDYVAGVVAKEIGGFNNKESFKTLAIAARTYGQIVASDDCTIKNSEQAQTFLDITNSTNPTHLLIYEAVEETKGMVVLDKDGNLFFTEYDAFCYLDKDNNYYTLSQKNQKIPIDWVQNNIGTNYYTTCPCSLNDTSMTQCWENDIWQDGGHGRGMSQYGVLYLATEKKYTYDEIIEYYYGKDTQISKQFVSSIAGLEIKNTTNASSLNTKLSDFLNSKGSNIESMNQFIHDSVVEKGAGTREGVVTAAVSLINYLYDNYNTKLPYYWGGAYQYIGISPSFGSYAPSTPSRSGKTYYYTSFDCSGFVSWAIKNGGYNIARTTSYEFDAAYSGDSCNIENTSCVGQPGDLINAPNDHVEMIVAVNTDANIYYIAHSGSEGVVVKERPMHTRNSSGKTTKILHMDSYYNNQINVNLNY